jgi:Domain of unknown function (DUF5122) beta-propeller
VRVRRLILAVTVGCLLALVSATSAAAALRVDRSFGGDGIVEPSVPGHDELAFLGMTAGPRGSVYLLACDKECKNGIRVLRLRADGTQDPTYGTEFGTVPLGTGTAKIAVDSAGRLLAAVSDGTSIAVERFDSQGRPDPSFGDAGRVRLDCDCLGELLLEPAGPERILVGRERSVDFYPPEGGEAVNRVEFHFWRLRGDGSLDPTFGSGGVSVVNVDGAYGESIFSKASFTRPDGPTVLAGVSDRSGIFVQRVAASGMRYLGFAAHTQRDLAGLRPGKGKAPSFVSSVVPRARGGFDVLGTTDGFTGFVLRFRKSGKLDRSFGKDGLRQLPYFVRSAAIGKRGRVFAIGGGAAAGEGSAAFWLRPAGGIERVAGSPRVVHLRAWNANQSTVAVLRGRRPIVFNTGFDFCRYACRAAPKLIRFVG